MDIVALTILYRIGIWGDIGHSRSSGQRDTWSALSSAGEGHRNLSHSPHSPPTTLNYNIYADRTGNLLVAIRSSARNPPASIYITPPDLHWSSNTLKAFTLHPSNSNISQNSGKKLITRKLFFSIREYRARHTHSMHRTCCF